MRHQLSAANMTGLYSVMQNMVNTGTPAAIFSTNVCRLATDRLLQLDQDRKRLIFRDSVALVM